MRSRYRVWVTLAASLTTVGSASAQLIFSDQTEACGLISQHEISQPKEGLLMPGNHRRPGRLVTLAGPVD